MPQSWITGLSKYNYPVSLLDYRRSGGFVGTLRSPPQDLTSRRFVVYCW